MRVWLLALLATGAVQAAVIRGMVVEHQSGKPLARTLIVAQPVPGTSGATLSVRSNQYGAFQFPPLSGGAYLVSASRRSFAPVQYGQKRWKGSAVPVVLEEAATTAIIIRMQRLASIAGAVLDENDVGMPEHDVGVYRNTRPPQFIKKDKTDERGMYRLWGLEPGSYLVRTLGKQYEDAGYLPTFSRETPRAGEARPVELQLDEQVTEVNVRPVPGQLFTVAGRAVSPVPGRVTLVLSSDIGIETAVSENDGSFQFNHPMPPGAYELLATIPADRTMSRMLAGWIPLMVDRHRSDWRINLGSLPEIRIAVEDLKGNALDAQSLSIAARRKDAASESQPETLQLIQGGVPLLPGRWDFQLTPPVTHYLAGFVGLQTPRSVPADGRNEMVLQGTAPALLKFTLSDNAGSISGEVASAGKPVAGAPVFLEAFDLESRRRLSDIVHSTRSDTRGQYRFNSLAPGTYRILSTFEFQAPEPAAMDAGNPKSIRVEQGQNTTVPLDLYATP